VTWYEKWKDYTSYTMLLTGKSPEEMALTCTKKLFEHTYFSWKALKNEFDPNVAKELYWRCWEELVKLGFEKAKETLNIKDVRTLQELGSILQHFHLDVLTPSEIVKETDEEHVSNVTWCPNPELGPPDTHTERIAYYRVESELTLRVARLIAELAGFADKVNVKLSKAICLGDPICQIIYEVKK
jgi:hypothetical protein